MHLVNPITCEQIALPSVITIEQVKPVFDAHGVLHKYELSWQTGTDDGRYIAPSVFALDKLRDELHYKAFVFSDDASTSTGSYIVVLIHNPICQLSFARAGDDKWTWLPPHEFYLDCTYKDGLLYAVTGFGELHAFDLRGPDITVEVILQTRHRSECGYMYVVQAPWGNLLLIWRICEDYHLQPNSGTPVSWNTTGYKIYEYDPSGSTFKELNCLRGHALFLGHNQSLCLSADEYPSLKENHVYFTEHNLLLTLGCENDHHDMGILNLADNSREEIVSPHLWSNRPAPIWITPDLTKRKFVSGQDEEKKDRRFQ
jgi:hypothetical protein